MIVFLNEYFLSLFQWIYPLLILYKVICFFPYITHDLNFFSLYLYKNFDHNFTFL